MTMGSSSDRWRPAAIWADWYGFKLEAFDAVCKATGNNTYSGTTYIKARDQDAILINRTLVTILPDLPEYIFQISRFHAVNLDAIRCIQHEDRIIRAYL